MNTPHSRGDIKRSAILAQLGASGPASRADLARSIGVSPALVTQITRDLVLEGLIEELHEVPSNGGRPARLIGLVHDAGSAIGVKLAIDHVAFVELTLDGSVVRTHTAPFDATRAGDIDGLIAELQAFTDKSQARRLLGIGVGVPGSVADRDSGLVDSAPFGWQQRPFGSVLSAALHLPVLVENTVSALAIAEQLYGAGTSRRDFLVVTIGVGVGAAIVSDGRLIRGDSGGAGELAHVRVTENGPLCECGNRGCLETLISEKALLDAARTGGLDVTVIEDLHGLADDGDDVALQIFHQAATYLGLAVASAVQFLEPAALIMSGEGTAGWRFWALPFEQALRSAVMGRRRHVEIIVEHWNDDRWAQGAAALVLATPLINSDEGSIQGGLVRQRLLDGARS